MGYQPLKYSTLTHKEEDLDLRLQLVPSMRDNDNDETSSMITIATSPPPEECTSNSFFIGKRHNYVRSTSLARFKGVIPQQNGHWGAQIYADHNRIWLGTFNTEREAAMAYDSAALKLNPGINMHRNFPVTEITVHEPTFQKKFSMEAVLKMIKAGSYEHRFIEFFNLVHDSKLPAQPTGFILLFEKELTPSDVGRLNRLVIPKKLAEKYFPPVSEDAKDFLEFKDCEGGSWSFRYNYWPSSQGYVFTAGWRNFVKEKKLKNKDKVLFYWCGDRREYIIDLIRKDVEDLEEEDEEVVESATKKLKLFGFWVA